MKWILEQLTCNYVMCIFVPHTDRWMNNYIWNNTDRGKIGSTQKKTCPSGTLHTTDTTWTGLCLSLGLWIERPVTNHQSHSVASAVTDMWMVPVFQVKAVVLPWFVHLHSIKGKIIMNDQLGRMKEQVLLVSIKNSPGVWWDQIKPPKNWFIISRFWARIWAWNLTVREECRCLQRWLFCCLIKGVDADWRYTVTISYILLLKLAP